MSQNWRKWRKCCITRRKSLTGLVSWGRGRECPQLVKNETFSIRQVARFRYIQWCSDASDLVPVLVSTDCKRLRGQVSWQVGSLDQKHLWHVICRCYVSTEWWPSTHIQSNATFFCKSKTSPSRKTCGRNSHQMPTQWTTLSGRILRPALAMFVTQTLPCTLKSRQGMDGHEQGLHYQKLQGFQTPS